MSDLYSLTFYDDLDGYPESFHIGIFPSHSEAENMAKKYLKEVSGFKDYPCTYEITAKSVIGKADAPDKVSMIFGWNYNDSADEVDIWESSLYADRDEAEAALAIIMQKLSRQEWCINTYKVGECDWQEGFIRI